jgi:hypothetical protein
VERTPPSDLPCFCPRPDFSSLSVRDLVDAGGLSRPPLEQGARDRDRLGATDPEGGLVREEPAWHRAAPGWKGRGPDLFNSVITPGRGLCARLRGTSGSTSAWSDGSRCSPTSTSRAALPSGRPDRSDLRRPPETARARPQPPPVRFPKQFVGAATPLHVAGSRRTGSVGCLVTDGHNTYALTNRHVTGDEQAPSRRFWEEKRYPSARPACRSSGSAASGGLRPWPGRRVFVNLLMWARESTTRAMDDSGPRPRTLGPVDLSPTPSPDPRRPAGPASARSPGRLGAHRRALLPVSGDGRVPVRLRPPDRPRRRFGLTRATRGPSGASSGRASAGPPPDRARVGGQVETGRRRPAALRWPRSSARF